MSDKAQRKRQFIIETARDVFVKKGYRDVTMKDIVEACEISRGGLYLYFASVEEVFLAVLEQEEEKKGMELTKEKLENCSPSELLLVFLKEQKKEILAGQNSLAVAKYEYAFVCREEKKPTIFKSEYEKTTLVLARILDKGNAMGEFDCVSPGEEAGHIMFALEGLKACAHNMGVSESRVDREILYMMKKILIEE